MSKSNAARNAVALGATVLGLWLLSTIRHAIPRSSQQLPTPPEPPSLRPPVHSPAIPTRRVVRITLVVAATLIGVALLYSIRHVILLAAVSAFLAIALEPAVTFLQRLVRSRVSAIGVMMAMLVLAIGAFVASVAPPIVDQVQNLDRKIPQYARQFNDSSTTLGELQRRFRITDRLEPGVKKVTSAVSNVGGVFGTIASVITNVLVVMVLTVYFLANAPRIKQEGLRLLPLPKRKRTAAVMDEVFGRVGGWMEGNILISLIAGVVSYFALLAIGVPYPHALAMWVAITDLIPMVGAMLGALVCVLVAFFAGVSGGMGATPGVLTAAFFLAYQQVENYVISPRVMKRTVDISAVTVILAALIGGTLLGPVGVLLAVPAAAAIKVVANELWLSERATR